MHDNETATLTMTLPSTANELGVSVTGTLTCSAGARHDIAVQLTSSDPAQIAVPETVILPAGQTSVDFTATLLDDHIMESGPNPVALTASVENWTSGSATINVLDGDHTMTVMLPTSGWEGQTLSGAGTIQIGGTLTTDLVVSLASSDTTQLSVPATVTIPAGQLSANFDVTLVDNGLRTGPQSETLTATASGLPTAVGSMVVDDADLDHLTVSTIAGPQTAGVPFTVTATAYDILGNVIQVYDAAATLGATGSSGICRRPTTVTFVNGVWTGDVAVNAVDPSVTLQVTDPTSGIAATSNVFATQAGPLASFQWSTIASPEYQGASFPVTLTAKDANGYTVTDFDGNTALTGWVGQSTTAPPAGTPIATREHPAIRKQFTTRHQCGRFLD